VVHGEPGEKVTRSKRRGTISAVRRESSGLEVTASSPEEVCCSLTAAMQTKYKASIAPQRPGVQKTDWVL
jgi:hypothetical protein